MCGYHAARRELNDIFQKAPKSRDRSMEKFAGHKREGLTTRTTLLPKINASEIFMFFRA